MQARSPGQSSPRGECAEGVKGGLGLGEEGGQGEEGENKEPDLKKIF